MKWLSLKIWGWLLLVCAGCNGGVLIYRDTSSAESTYTSAVEHLEAGLYSEAESLLQTLKSQFPYSRHAALADLKLADCYLRQGKHTEAIEQYRLFLRFHPYHTDAAWAMYHLAESYYQTIGNDWWLMPPTSEKDPSSINDALQAFQALLQQYPTGVYAEKAKDRIGDCELKLANHELYVAQYYLQHQHYTGAKWRAERLLSRFSSTKLRDKASWIIAQAHVRAGESAQAVAVLRQFVKTFPQSHHHQEAQALLGKLTSPTTYP